MSVDLERHELMNKGKGYFEAPAGLVVETDLDRPARKPHISDPDTQSEPSSTASSPTDPDLRTSWLLGIKGDDAKSSLKFFHERRSSDEGVPPRRSESAERPALVRKKSGELVKSSLKLPTLARTRSMPNTKTVHFDSNLEHVRRFNYREKPTKVSFEWGGEDVADESDDDDLSEDESVKGWSISTPNFTPPSFERVEGKDRPLVYLDSLFLSPDTQYLRGNVCVRNISFSKQVTIRYTIDYWQTLSEVEAHYNSDIRRLDRAAGYDRFSFQIPLATLPSRVLRKASLFLCARYSVNDNVYWDNNNKLNYEVVFHRGSHKVMPQQKRMSAPPHFVSRSFSSSDDAFPLDDVDNGLTSTPSEIFNSVAIETRDSSVKLASSKEPSDLKSRYSFGSAFNQPLRSPFNGGLESNGGARPTGGNKDVRIGRQAVDGNGSPTQRAPAKRVFPATNNPTQFQMDSTGYQDILSRFCFAGSESNSPPDQKVADKRPGVSPNVSTPISPAASPAESPPLEPSQLPRTTSYSALRMINPPQRQPAIQHG